MKKISPYRIATTILGVALLVVLSFGFLSGCGKNTVDYSIDDSQEEQNGMSAGSSDGQNTLAGTLGISADTPWETTVSATLVTGNTADIHVKAAVSVPDTQNMYVAEGTMLQMDETMKENILKTFFGESTIYYHDEAHWTKEEIQKVLEEKQKEYEIYDDEATLGNMDTLERMESRIKQLEQAYENATDDYTAISDYKGDQYLGYKDGVRYLVEFTNANFVQGVDNCGCTEVSIAPYALEDVCPEDFSDCFLVYNCGAGEDNAENLCKMSAEDARAEADYMLSQLGMSDMQIDKTYDFSYRGAKKVDGETELTDITTNGYIFCYKPVIGDIKLDVFGLDRDYLYPNCYIESYTDYSFTSGIEVYVNDCGVFQISMHNPYQIEHSAPVSLLPFDTVCELFTTEIRERGASYHLKSTYYHALDLIYLRVTPQKGSSTFSYIPVWRLCNISSEAAMNAATYDQPIFINAIDGSAMRWEDICPYIIAEI